MSLSSHTILCGSCKREAKSVPNPKPHDKVTCSGCGREDSFENVMRSVKDYITHSAAQYLSKGIADAVRGSKFIKVTSQAPQHRSFRWITTELGL